jgi:hypothetical protein
MLGGAVLGGGRKSLGPSFLQFNGTRPPAERTAPPPALIHPYFNAYLLEVVLFNAIVSVLLDDPGGLILIV